MSSSELEVGWCRYFAFGSNMSRLRMVSRIAEATSDGRGMLQGWALRMNKRGRDGTAKANIERIDGSTVWGVVYRFPEAHLPRLDRFEGGYERISVTVLDAAERPLRCTCYASDSLLEHGACFDWYKNHMLDGAREHELPADYIAMIAAVPDCPSKLAGV
jgi:gamma-glutamylcyclotransferase